MDKIKRERFRITGIQYYQDDFVEELGEYNYDYDETASVLKETYYDGDKIYQYDFLNLKAELVPEPDNEYDSNAVAVLANGIKVGHVKKGSCTRVKNLLKSPDFVGIEIKITGGKYKALYEDENGKLRIEREQSPYFVDIDILTRDDSVPDPVPSITPEVVPKPLIKEDVQPKKDIKDVLRDKLRLLAVAAVFLIIIIIASFIVS